MRAVIQRVKAACLTANAKPRGNIGEGLVVLLGVCNDDTEEDVQWLVRKIIGLRVFSDAEGVMNLDIKSLPPSSKTVIKIPGEESAPCRTGDIMVVSQFTLYASYKKGNRPSWLRAAGHDVAVPLYQRFCEETERALGKRIVTGEFGADMKVLLLNDGPVTICMDTKNRE